MEEKEYRDHCFDIKDEKDRFKEMEKEDRVGE